MTSAKKAPTRADALHASDPQPWGDLDTEPLNDYLRGTGLAVRMVSRGPDGQWEAAFVRRLIERSRAHFQSIEDAGSSPATALGDPIQLADRLIDAAPLEPSPLEDLVGPFYDTSGLRRWLNVSRQALLDRVKARTLLGMQTGDRTWVYPAWQFTTSGNGRTIPHLSDVLRALATGTDDPWTWALWLQAPDKDLDGMTSAAWLADGRDPVPVLHEARADAARWAA